ncbi:MAG: beta strand repeat-containing protein, partial [Planctomycetota bacterium]
NTGDEIDGRGGIDTIDAGSGDDLIIWDLEEVVLGNVQGGLGTDTLEITATTKADEFEISSPSANNVKVEKTNAGSPTSITASGIEILDLDLRGGADTAVVRYLAGSNVDTVKINAGSKRVVTGRLVLVTDEIDGDTIRFFEPEILIIDDGAADTIHVFGSAGDDNVVVSDDGTDVQVDFVGVVDIFIAGAGRAKGDTLIIETLGGGDNVDASAVSTDLIAIEIRGNEGDDTLVGTPFNDVFDGGTGSDTVTGGEGKDTFRDTGDGVDNDDDGLVDEAGEDGVDTLLEAFNKDVGLFNSHFLVGELWQNTGTTPFASGLDPNVELIHVGDRWNPANTTVEKLNGLFEVADITGGASNNTFVVNDLDTAVRVGAQVLTVVNWRGRAILDNAANDNDTEHYLVTVPTGNPGEIEIDDSGGSADDRLVITGTGQADRFTLDVPSNDVGRAVANRNASTVITHENVEYVEFNTRGGDDRIAVRAIHTQTTLNLAVGDDIAYVGSLADVIPLAPTNLNGNVNAIDALLTVNGQDGEQDVLDVDETGDTGDNVGVLTPTTITGLGMGGSITYGSLETLNIDLGNASNSNDFTVVDTHGGGGKVTNITSGSGSDDFKILAIDNPTNIDSGAGNDAFLVGSDADQPNPLTGTLDTIVNGRLTLLAGDGGGDQLFAFDAADPDAELGILTANQLTLLGMTLGIQYEAFEQLEIWLGAGNNTFFVESTHAGQTTIHGGDETPIVNVENDVFNIESTTGPTIIEGGKGNDVFRVNFDQDGKQTFLSGIGGELTLRGQQGSDLYEVGLSGLGSSVINVDDQSGSDLGVDLLDVFGTNDTDFILLRANKELAKAVVAAIEVDENREPVDDGVIERVNYDGNIARLTIFGRGGDDTFVLDDNLAQTVIFGDAGDDTFQIGQVFASARDGTNPDNGLDPIDFFETTQITRGFLSNGISENATLFGGIGKDNFTVYRNLAELFLFGDEDDDTFTVRAFVQVDPNDPKAPFTNINGGQGADFIAFTVNAPVRIDGGDGLDTLTVIGTEFGDDFVVTDQGVFGAGLFVTYTGIEKVVVDALEGNDRFFIQSTSEGVALEIVGGVGSDTFNVGGSNGEAVTVVSNSLEGHSGLVIHTVSSDDPEYQAIFAQDIATKVSDNDEPGAVVILNQGPQQDFQGPLRVFEDPTADDGLIFNTYSIILTRSPEENIRITASPVPSNESEEEAGGAGIRINGSTAGVTLLFDRTNWFIPQTITVSAPDDLLAEGRRFINIQHSVIQGPEPGDGGAYDGLIVPGVVVEVIDNDAADVLIARTGDDTLVNEGASGDLTATDSYSVVLTKKPTAGEDVVIGIVPTDSQVTVSAPTLTFTTADWNVPQVVTVTVVNDTDKEATHFSRIRHEILSGLTNYLGLTLDDVANGLAASVNKDLEQDLEAAVTYTDVDVDIVGSPAADETWTLTLNGVDYTFESAGNSPSAVASGLASEIDGEAGFTATSVDSTLSISHASPFTVAFDVTGDDPRGGVVIAHDGAPVNVSVFGPAFQATLLTYHAADVTLGGTPAPGELWTLTIDDVDYTYEVQESDGVNEVAAELVGLIPGTFTPSAVNNVISLSGTGFAVVFSIDDADSLGEATISGTPVGDRLFVLPTFGTAVPAASSEKAWEAVAIQLTGTTDQGATWIVELDGAPFQYVVSGESESLADVAAGLANTLIGSGFRAATQYTVADVSIAGAPAEGEIWTVFLDGTPFSYEVQAADDADDVASGLAAAIQNAFSTATVTLTGAVVEGEVGTLTLNGEAFSYTVLSGNGLTEIATGLDAAVGSAFDVSASGAVLTLNDPPGPPITPVLSIDDAVGGATIAGTLQTTFVATAPGGGVVHVTIDNSTPFALAVSVDDPESEGVATVSGTPTGDTLFVDTLDGRPFTVEVTRLPPGGVGDAETGGSVQTGDPFTQASPDRWGQLDVALQGSGDIVEDVAEWTLRLGIEGEDLIDYDYVAGLNREIRIPNSIDVRITDDDTPGILVIESGGFTRVTELSDLVVLGSGFVTAIDDINFPTDGQFEGDFGVAMIEEVANHNTALTAQNIDLAKWNANADPNIAQSTVLPHLTILGTGNDQEDFFSFEITQEMIDVDGEVTALFDIDHGLEFQDFFTENPLIWVSKLTLLREVRPDEPTAEYNAVDVLLAGTPTEGEIWTLTIDGIDFNYQVQEFDTLTQVASGLEDAIGFAFDATAEDSVLAIEGSSFTIEFSIDNPTTLGAATILGTPIGPVVVSQSPFFTNPFNIGQSGFGSSTFGFTVAGTYFIKVENIWPFGGLQVGVVPDGVDYELNVSIENHEVDGFLFAPAPVFENEVEQEANGFQDIDAATNFFTFFDPTIGNQDFVGAGDPFVDFQTPYARIQGEGDGTIDIFQFEIS